MTQPELERDLGSFSIGDYQAGRGIAWKVSWFTAQNILFRCWWFPARFRPSLLRAFGAEVGEGCVIRHGVRIHWPWNLRLGNNVWIGEYAWLHSLVDITVGDDVCISQFAAVVTGSHDANRADFAYDNAPVVIERGAWIEARAMVLRGVTIGHHAIVGANAVAYKDLAPRAKLGATVLLREHP